MHACLCVHVYMVGRRFEKNQMKWLFLFFWRQIVCRVGQVRGLKRADSWGHPPVSQCILLCSLPPDDTMLGMHPPSESDRQGSLHTYGRELPPPEPDFMVLREKDGPCHGMHATAAERFPLSWGLRKQEFCNYQGKPFLKFCC